MNREDTILQEILDNALNTVEDSFFNKASPKVVPAPESDKGPESKNDKETHTQWALAGNDRFIPVGATASRVPAGVYEPFATPGMWGLEKLNVESDGIYRLPDMATDLVMKEVQTFWESEHKYRRHKLLFKRGLILWGPAGCLEADTYVAYTSYGPDGKRRNHKGGSIERLYQVFHRLTGPGKGRYQKAPADSEYYLSSIDDRGLIVHNRIMDVVYSGENPVYSITTRGGLSITATSDHKFFTGDGYKRLGDLKIGDTVYVHNNTVFKDAQVPNNKQERKFVYVKSHPYARHKLVGDHTYFVIPKARAIVEAYINGLSLEAYVHKLNAGCLSGLELLDPRVDVHHKDENYLNDSLENLQVISHSEHARLHSTKRPVRYVATEDAVSSIDYIDVRPTFDIVMAGPYHNFVADGFIVHNSGKSVTIKLLMNELIARDGIVIIVNNISLCIEALKAIRRIEPERNLICVFEDIDEIIHYNSEASVLSMLDGEHNISRILNIASTNHPERLGARIINRPSRFDRRLHIGMPSRAAREAYLRKATGGELSEDQIAQWVNDTDTLSIAHLRELVAAVYCLGQPYADVLERLISMAEMIKPEEELKRRGVGFASKMVPAE